MALSETVTIDCLSTTRNLREDVVAAWFQQPLRSLFLKGESKAFTAKAAKKPGIKIPYCLRMFLAPKQGRAQSSSQPGENHECNQGADQGGCEQ